MNSADGVEWRQLIREAILPRNNEEQLASTVWYVEAYFPDPKDAKKKIIQSGTAVILRIATESKIVNAALTCAHVIFDQVSHRPPLEVRIWPHNSGYNPECTDEKRIWKATLLRKGDEIVGGNVDFEEFPSSDWVFLTVTEREADFDKVPFALGTSAAGKSFFQLARPYRLFGFPAGKDTMPQNVVRVSVSRNFRISDTDAKFGTRGLVGPEGTEPGYSGGPYFTGDGKLVAIHRHSAKGLRPTGIDAVQIESSLRDLGWQLIALRTNARTLLAIRALLAFAILSCLLIAWKSLKPPTLTVFAIEGKVSRLSLDCSGLELVPSTQTSLKSGVTKILEGGDLDDLDTIITPAATFERNVFGYKAGQFSAYKDNSGFIAEERLWYRKRQFGIPLPAGEIVVKVRKHLIFADIAEFQKEISKLNPTDDAYRWWFKDAALQPVFTIDAIPSTEGLDIDMERKKITFQQELTDGRGRVELRLMLGDHSPVKRLFRICGTGSGAFKIHCVAVDTDPEAIFSFDPSSKFWQMELKPALDMSGRLSH